MGPWLRRFKRRKKEQKGIKKGKELERKRLRSMLEEVPEKEG
jgi:hypothetical protein